MELRKAFFLVILFCCTLINSNVIAEEGTYRRPPKEKWTHEKLQATVESINLESREAVVRGPEGNMISLKVDERVERFHEIKAGDVVSVDYWMFITAEFRDPTAAEKQRPLLVLAEAGKAPEGVDPAAEVGAVIRAVVTVEVINRPKMTVTVKGPRGNFVTVPIEDKSLIEQLNVGEIAVVTYSEALALSVEKAK